MIKEFRILVGGFGGQGVLLAGKLLADACVQKGYKVSWLPSYGPEMRGGTCNCRVVISEENIVNPIFSRPNVLLVLNKNSALKFVPTVKEDGIIVSNSSLVNKENILNKNCKIEEVRATEIAKVVGTSAVANVIMLGKLVKQLNFLTLEDLEKSLAHKFKGEILKLNKKALLAGYNN